MSQTIWLSIDHAIPDNVERIYVENIGVEFEIINIISFDDRSYRRSLILIDVTDEELALFMLHDFREGLSNDYNLIYNKMRGSQIYATPKPIYFRFG